MTPLPTLQLPGVKLEFCRGKGIKAEHHVLDTSLTPEGTRAYKIDGKHKTATQVKVGLLRPAFLTLLSTWEKQSTLIQLPNGCEPWQHCLAAGLSQ